MIHLIFEVFFFRKFQYYNDYVSNFNFKKEIAKSVLIGMIAALAGGPDNMVYRT